MGQRILTINAGSSSVKFALYTSGEIPDCLAQGLVQDIGSTPSFRFKSGGATDTKLIDAKDADYLLGTALVFGVSINGDTRAYPLRIMGWHEMFNEVIGGVPVALAYCTLCGSGILFETAVEGRARPFVFGSSGFLYRSNKLMFDRETNSLWNQFTGKPVAAQVRKGQHGDAHLRRVLQRRGPVGAHAAAAADVAAARAWIEDGAVKEDK